MKNTISKLDKKELIENFKKLKKKGEDGLYIARETSFAKKLESIIFLHSFKAVLVLMALVVLYYLFIAANRYVSESVITVKSVSSDSGITISGLGGLLGSQSTGSAEDVSYLKTYISSPDMLKILQEEIDIKGLYSSQKLDVFFSISKDANEDAFLKYYQERLKISDQNGLLKIEIEGFSPEQARLINAAILKESERFVNELSHKNAREQLSFAESELLKYKEKYQSAVDKLTAFQNEHGVFDPLQEAQSRASLIAEMEGNLSQKQAQLLAMQSYINDSAPQLVSLKAEIKALQVQLKREKARIASKDKDQKLNDLAALFQNLSIETSFAETAYTTALKSYEATRIDTIRKLKYLIVVQTPTMPESALYPRKLYNILTIFVILSLIFGIVKLVKTIIEEHKY